MNARVLCGLCLAIAVTGCRNLELPAADALNLADGGRSPYLALDFDSGATVALSAPLSFTANSLEGIAEVSVYCGAQALARWTTPPFQGQVDLTPCVPPLPPSDGGVDLRELSLVAVALDTHGHRSDVSFTLKVDVSIPVLTTDLPERIRPDRPLDFTVRTSLPPAELPVVTLADLPVTLTADAADPRLFHAHLPKTPALGIDALDGGAVTLDVLQDVERTVALEAEAMAPNGNRGKLSQSVLLTRVLWDKALPAPLAQDLAQFQPEPLQAPTAIPEGLVVALSGSVSGGTGFTPAVFAADGGRLTVDQPLLDGGWYGFEIDAEGWVSALSAVDAGGSGLPTPTVYLSALDAGVAVPILDTPSALPVRVRGDGQLCGLVGVSDVNNCASSSATLTCVDHLGQAPSVPLPQLQAGVDEGAGVLSDLVAARSGEAVFFGGPAPCGDTTGAAGFGVGTRDGGLSFHAGAADAIPVGYADCEYSQVYPVLPAGDGSFVLMPKRYCHLPSGGAATANGQPVLLIGPDGGIAGRYAATSPWEPGRTGSVGVMGSFGPGHDLMVLKPSLSGTALSLFPPDGGAPSVATVLPGVYEYPPDQRIGGGSPPSLSMPRDVVRGDAGVAVLTLTSQYSRALVALGPDLQPRWIYRYPRLVVFQDSLRLYALDDGGPLYLVDTANQRVVAIER